MIRSRRALSILLLFALAACSSSDGGGDRTAGLEGEDVPISPTPEPVYTVGALDGEPWETFGNVSHVAFDRDGALYALDRDAGHVVVFDPAGTYVRTISQAGEGPGELGNPIGLVLLADGRVVVFDFAKQGLQVFSSDGEFLESVAFDPQDGMPGARLWALPDASVVTVGGIRIRMGPDGLADEPPGRPIDRFRLDGSQDVLYTAWEAPPPEEEAENEVSAGSQRIQFRMPALRAFEPQLHVGVLSDGRVAVADSVGYRVKLVDAAGLVSSTLERPIAPIAVTDEIQEAELARQLEELEQRGGGVMRLVARSGDGGNMEVDNESVRQMMEDRVRSMVFADEVPVIRNFAVDWSDRVWVERAERPGAPGPTDVLTADGGYLGTIASDGMRIPAAFGPDGLLAYVERDELDVQRIRVSRLEGDEALEAGGR